MLVTHRLTLNEKARRVTVDDREFLVAPVVAAVGGVMNGALATAEAFAESAAAWEGMPITLNHPTDAQGVHVSAFAAGVQHVGYLASPVVDGKFRAEAWFDLAALEGAGDEGQEVITNLEAGELTEVSTGYFCDLEPKKGIYQGRVYFGVQHNIRPDHLAILPHEIGACSVADGCGIPRTNVERRTQSAERKTQSVERRTENVERRTQSVERRTENGPCACKALNQQEAGMPVRTIVINEELSLSEQMSQVYDAWYAYVKTAPPVPSKAEDRLYVREVFADHVIVSGHPDGLLSYPYTTNADGITFGEPVQVEIVYQPVSEMATNASALTWLQKIWSRLNQPQAQTPSRSEEMDRDLTINQILAAEGNKFSKTTLQKLGDDELTQVVTGLATNAQPPAPAGDPAPPPTPDPALATLTQAVEALTARMDTFTANQQATETTEHAQLVAALVANEACPLPEDVLTAMALPALRKTHAAYSADYSGRGGLRLNQTGVESLEAPIMALN